MVTGARSTPFKAFLGNGYLWKSFSVPAAKAYYRISDPHRVKLINQGGPRELIVFPKGMIRRLPKSNCSTLGKTDTQMELETLLRYR